MIFELMARKGYMESWKEAKLYVKNSKEVSVKREKPDAVSVIKEIHKLGGIIILAHPYLISEPVSYKGKEMSRQEFIEVLIEAGLDGIEASYTYKKRSDRTLCRPWLNYFRRFRLSCGWKERCKESPGNWRVWNYQRGFHEI